MDASRARARNVSGVSHSEHQNDPVALAWGVEGPCPWGSRDALTGKV